MSIPLHSHLKKLLLSLVLSAICKLCSFAQVNAYFNFACFDTPQQHSFVETYLTITGHSLASKQLNGKFQNSVNIELLIYKDTNLIKANKYNLISPSFTAPTEAPTFIDVQRYSLNPGKYFITLVLTDNYSSNTKALTIKDVLTIDFDRKSLYLSDLEALESYKKSLKPSTLSKSGFDMVPYTVNYYPESINDLCFYLEAYQADKTFGLAKNFVFTYYLELAETGKKMELYGAFQKQTASTINPLLAKMDISKLGTGNYYLIIELRDENNIQKAFKKYYFQRLNRMVDIVSLQVLQEKQTLAEYFGKCTNSDTLKMYVECLWPIADGVDKERIINQSVKKDPELMKKFVIDFWQRRSADTANPLKMWANYYKSVQQVMVLFKCGKQPGYYSDRGRVYLQYGAPSQRAQQANEHNTFPYEIWQYYRTTDATNGQFFSNRKFVFVNKKLGDDCYDLVHSDMRGELNNPRWQYEITRRNNKGIGNPDNNTPPGTESNQFNDIYNNPR